MMKLSCQYWGLTAHNQLADWYFTHYTIRCL